MGYHNLVADPRVHVQVGAEKFEGIARVASGTERARLWPMMTKIWPEYEKYQAKVERELPVVVLERA
jgi:deazaflavin-dependent oxidoreductase (nitroreductase family)